MSVPWNQRRQTGARPFSATRMISCFQASRAVCVIQGEAAPSRSTPQSEITDRDKEWSWNLAPRADLTAQCSHLVVDIALHKLHNRAAPPYRLGRRRGLARAPPLLPPSATVEHHRGRQGARVRRSPGWTMDGWITYLGAETVPGCRKSVQGSGDGSMTPISCCRA